MEMDFPFLLYRKYRVVLIWDLLALFEEITYNGRT